MAKEIDASAKFAASPQVTQYACNCVSNIFNGLSYESCMKVSNASFSELTELDKELNTMDRYGIDIASIFEIVQQVIEMVMKMIEDCNNQKLFARLVKQQRPISRAWFRVNVFNKKKFNSLLRDRQVDDLFEICCAKASELPETIIESIWIESTKPDFNIF
jgi:hypothetical protein